MALSPRRAATTAIARPPPLTDDDDDDDDDVGVFPNARTRTALTCIELNIAMFYTNLHARVRDYAASHVARRASHVVVDLVVVEVDRAIQPLGVGFSHRPRGDDGRTCGVLSVAWVVRAWVSIAV